MAKIEFEEKNKYGLSMAKIELRINKHGWGRFFRKISMVRSFPTHKTHTHTHTQTSTHTYTHTHTQNTNTQTNTYTHT